MWPGIQSKVLNINAVWKSVHKYVKARTILAISTFKVNINMYEQPHPKRREDMALLHYTPIGTVHIIVLCHIQSKDADFSSFCKKVFTLMVVNSFLYTFPHKFGMAKISILSWHSWHSQHGQFQKICIFFYSWKQKTWH